MSPYVGLWMRLSHRFSSRRAEWMASMFAFGFGTQLCFIPDIMDRPQWALFKSIAPPMAWGLLLAVNGAVCLAALVINGSKKHLTPQIRMGAAVIRLFIWAGMWLVFAFGGIIGLWLTLYSVLFAFEWTNLAAAAKDTGEAHATARLTGHINASR